MARVIKLTRTWTIGAQIGGGGFGRVYEAAADDGMNAVAKLVPKMPGAEREMLFADLLGAVNVVPIIESGEESADWVLIMPKAETSLRAHLAATVPALPLDQALPVLIDVAESLASLQGTVVHRDLKPENILLLGGHWCLADFGIARYAEATTAKDTWKHAWTGAYAAPERWRDERATGASDIYSFGVMAYEILVGQLPFPGPDFRQQHLTQAPPHPNLPAALESLVLECLFKAPGARPSAANIAPRLQNAVRPASTAAALLQQANQAVVVARSKAVASASAAEQEEERRSSLASAADPSLKAIVAILGDAILQAAPATRDARSPRGGELLSLELNGAPLVVSSVQRSRPGSWGAYPPNFDAIAHATIRLRTPNKPYGYGGRSHSLWFCDADDPRSYRWIETAFMMLRGSGPDDGDPFALDPSEEAGVAIAPVTGHVQIAWPPTPFDHGAHEEFVERWMEWFAKASLGQLQHPSSMPERSGGFKR